jgi:hypothetical protein
MFFSDWQTNTKYKDSKISPALLWEYNLETFDWQAARSIVVERVLKLGNRGDFYAAIRLYGGLENFRKIIRDEVGGLNSEDISLVKNIFQIPENELNSVKRQEAREKALGFKRSDLGFPEWAW